MISQHDLKIRQLFYLVAAFFNDTGVASILHFDPDFVASVASIILSSVVKLIFYFSQTMRSNASAGHKNKVIMFGWKTLMCKDLRKLKAL